jgi:hypothetical protein
MDIVKPQEKIYTALLTKKMIMSFKNQLFVAQLAKSPGSILKFFATTYNIYLNFVSFKHINLQCSVFKFKKL